MLGVYSIGIDLEKIAVACKLNPTQREQFIYEVTRNTDFFYKMMNERIMNIALSISIREPFEGDKNG